MKFLTRHLNTFLFISFSILLTSCGNNNLREVVPDYIKIESALIENSEFFECNAAIYKIKIEGFDKNIGSNELWNETPIPEEIINGMSVKSSTLAIGQMCDGGLQGFSDGFIRFTEQTGSHYSYFDDRLFLLVSPSQKVLFIFYWKQ